MARQNSALVREVRSIRTELRYLAAVAHAGRLNREDSVN